MCQVFKSFNDDSINCALMEECANSISRRAWSQPIDLRQNQGKKKMFEKNWIETMDTGSNQDSHEDDDVSCWSETSMRFRLCSKYLKVKPC
jgi:hypothetical protein